MSVAPILFLMGLALSFGLDLLIPATLFKTLLLQNLFLGIGAFLVLLGTGLSFWAQKFISKNVHSVSAPTLTDLMQGPYRYSRHPGSLSLGIIFWGLALAINSTVMAILAVLFWAMMTMWFAPWEEAFMIKSVGQVYRDYQGRVRMWF
ncbi:MAG: isoprenylcysteine carboxylmethyltransferase family protein [Patescibacteria group bacterium]|nr:isoprenylcysteine carboxylmethyltransferase family protein [Patescibacteria group bacterium]